MIKFINLNLDKVSVTKQYMKATEEYEEYKEALTNYIKGNDTKEHVIEEFLDCFQAELGVLQKRGITAQDVMEGYPKHLEKMEHRPRD